VDSSKELYKKSLLEETLERIVAQAIDNVFEGVIPPNYQGSAVAKEFEVLIRAAVGNKKRPWKSILTVGIALMEKDVSVKDMTEQLKCNRSTAFRVLQRLQAYGFAEKASGHRYTLSKKNCPLLYYLCRKRHIPQVLTKP
jgi:Fic family protein